MGKYKENLMENLIISYRKIIGNYVDALLAQEMPKTAEKIHKEAHIKEHREKTLLEAQAKYEGMDIKSLLALAFLELSGNKAVKPETSPDKEKEQERKENEDLTAKATTLATASPSASVSVP